MTALATMFDYVLGWFVGLVFLIFDFERAHIDFSNIDSDVLKIAMSMCDYVGANSTNNSLFWPPLIIVGIIVIGFVVGLARRLIRG